MGYRGAGPLAVAALSLLLCGAGPYNGSDPHQTTPIDFEDLVKIAETRFDHPADEWPYDLPCELVGLDYDSWRLIHFRPDAALWRRMDAPFQVELNHRGYLFPHRVDIWQVTDCGTTPVDFDPARYEYRGWLQDYPLQLSPSLGHSGWRLLGEFPQSEYVREVATFLGGSYFRAVGAEHVYGSSARGLAIDMAMTEPEEFPRFTQTWLREPQSGEKTFRCWSLLQSPRSLGAYQFDITPGHDTVIEVHARLWLRAEVGKLCLAPLTSMWMWGGGSTPPQGDPRREVHDADGLLIADSKGDFLWRPLTRPQKPIVNHYQVPGLRGFGLLQRNRDPKDYGDSEARYHERPSVWVEPAEDWPAGAVELLRLPAHHEGIDNMGAFFLPAAPPSVGKPLDLHYRLIFGSNEPQIHRSGRFVRSHVRQTSPGEWSVTLLCNLKKGIAPKAALAAFEAATASDRERPEAEQPVSEEAAVEIDVWSQTGQVTARSCEAIGELLLVRFVVAAAAEQPVELLASLKRDGRQITETWSYQCEP